MINEIDNHLGQFLMATIDRFEGEQAVIKTDNGQEIIWPKNKLPANAAEGQVLKLRVETAEDQQQNREAIAKNILNEILKTDDDRQTGP